MLYLRSAHTVLLLRNIRGSCVPYSKVISTRWQSTTTTTITTSTTNSEPEPQSPQSKPEPPQNPNHHDLASFLSYAARTDLKPSSTVYVGTHYEYTVLASLRRLHLSLTRVGGRSDAGVDLLGHWNLPILEPGPLRVIVQCKALKDKAKPNLVRELEGAFAGAPAGWRGDSVLGMLVCPREATKGVRDALGRSALPLAWVLVGLGGEVKQCLWNQRATDLGLEGVGVTLRYKHAHARDGEEGNGQEGAQTELVLTWKGKIIGEPKEDIDTD